MGDCTKCEFYYAVMLAANSYFVLKKGIALKPELPAGYVILKSQSCNLKSPN